MAVAKDANRAMMVNTPSTELTAAGCENVAPFLITAEKHPIWVCDELEKILSMTDPSKSGIDNAMFGMADTSDEETGITAPPVIGTLKFNGQRLTILENGAHTMGRGRT